MLNEATKLFARLIYILVMPFGGIFLCVAFVMFPPWGSSIFGTLSPLFYVTNIGGLALVVAAATILERELYKQRLWLEVILLAMFVASPLLLFISARIFNGP